MKFRLSVVVFATAAALSGCMGSRLYKPMNYGRPDSNIQIMDIPPSAVPDDCAVSVESHAKPPFWFSLDSGGKRLLFIAADHGEEKTNKRTFDLIRKAFATRKFDRVVIESLESEDGFSPRSFLQDVKEGRRRMGEPAFTATEAASRGIEFIGGEVSDKELLGYLKEAGFSERDLAGFYILRTWNNDKTVELERLVGSKRWPEFLQSQFRAVEEFRDWFKSLADKELIERDPRMSQPFQGRSDLLQKLANEVTWARDRHLSKILKSAFDEKKDILVVYGAGHAESQKCYLKKQVSESFDEGKEL